jgi:curved DNA-binding protein CbpA
VDPHAVLGVSADADEEAINTAYRKLAKRFHPDRRPGDEAAVLRMAEINAAYALLRDSQFEMLRRRPAAVARPPGPPADVRRALGAELAGALDPGEDVIVVTDAATWDSFRVRLALSDRRLLWLRDDAPTDRIRYLRWRDIQTVDGRLKRPRRRVGELRVVSRAGKRVSFSELDPAALRLLLLGARKHVPA